MEDFLQKSADPWQPLHIGEQEVRARADTRTLVTLGTWAVMLIGVFIRGL